MTRDGTTPAGVAALYPVYRAELLRFLTARTGGVAAAEDVLQDLWLRIAAAPAGPVANGRAYLYRAAQNLVLDRLREAARRERRERDWADVTLDQRCDAPSPTTAGGADDAAIAQQDAARLADAIARLPPRAQQAFRLVKLDGLSYADAARRLGISVKGVEHHIAAAMARLRQVLREEELG